MRVRMLTLACGPDLHLEPKSEPDLPEDLALALVASGAAVALEEPSGKAEPENPPAASELGDPATKHPKKSKK